MSSNVASAVARLQLPLGWRVIPLQAGTKIPLPGSHGVHDAAVDVQLPPDCNIGLATGAKSGLFVLDFDCEKGIRTCDYLRRRCGELPKTPSVYTLNGGLHIYFRVPLFTRVASPVGLLPAMDVRGDGVYVVIPPSRLDKRSYEWRVSPAEADLAELPQSWFQYLDCCPDQSKRRRYKSPFTRLPDPNQLPRPPLITCVTPPKNSAKSKPYETCCPDNLVPPLDEDWHDGFARIGVPKKRHSELIKRIWETRPTEPGTRNGKLLELAQTLARWFSPEKTAAEHLAPCLRVWWHYARKVSKTPQPLNTREFRAVWQRTRWRPESLERWWRQSESEAVPIWAQQHFPNKTPMHRVVQFFEFVHRVHGDCFLGCRELAQLMGCSHVTAHRRLKRLEGIGALKCRRRGRASTKQATEWRWLGFQKHVR